jgi:hypothetical protein
LVDPGLMAQKAAGGQGQDDPKGAGENQKGGL